MDVRNVACHIHSWPKFLWTLDKIPTVPQDFEVTSSGRSFSIFRDPLPPQNNVGIVGQFGWINSALYWGWKGEGEGRWVNRKTICWQKCKVFWPGLYMHEFPVAVESHHLMLWHHVSKIVVIVIVSVYCTKISPKKGPK